MLVTTPIRKPMMRNTDFEKIAKYICGIYYNKPCLCYNETLLNDMDERNFLFQSPYGFYRLIFYDNNKQ